MLVDTQKLVAPYRFKDVRVILSISLHFCTFLIFSFSLVTFFLHLVCLSLVIYVKTCLSPFLSFFPLFSLISTLFLLRFTYGTQVLFAMEQVLKHILGPPPHNPALTISVCICCIKTCKQAKVYDIDPSTFC